MTCTKFHGRERQNEDPSSGRLHHSLGEGVGGCGSMYSPQSLGRGLSDALSIIKAQSTLISVFLK